MMGWLRATLLSVAICFQGAAGFVVRPMGFARPHAHLGFPSSPVPRRLSLASPSMQAEPSSGRMVVEGPFEGQVAELDPCAA